MANLSEIMIPSNEPVIVSIQNSGAFANVTQNLVISKIGNVVTVSSDRRLDLGAATVPGEWHSAAGLVPDWARPSATQTTDGSPRNIYGSSSGADLIGSCWVEADGTFVVKLTELSTATADSQVTSIFPVSVTYVVG